MRRAVPWGVLALLIAVAFLPALDYRTSEATPVGDGSWRITRYNAVLEVDDEGDLEVTETLIVDVPQEGRGGLARLFDEYDPQAPRSRGVPHRLAAVLDGRPAPIEQESGPRGRRHVVTVAPGRTLTAGEHTYVLRYEVDDVLRSTGADSSQFARDLVPGTWAQPVDAAELTVRLPAKPSSQVSCTEGAKTCRAQVDGTVVSVTAEGLAPRTPVRIVADLPVAAADGRQLWPVWLDPVLSRSWWLLALVAAAAAFAGWLGRRIASGTFDHEPTGLPRPDLPEGVDQEQARYLLTGRTHDPAVAPEVERWAKREGYVTAAGPRSLLAVGVVAALVAYVVWLSLLGGLMSVAALVPGAFAAMALPAVLPGTTAKRTNAGRRLAARIRRR